MTGLIKKGRLVVLVGPSAVGKSTVVRRLLALKPDLYFSVSVTTRKPRVGEIDGKDYFFVSKSQFKRMIADNEFLEWAEIYGGLQLSGTPKNNIVSKLSKGQDVLVEVDVVGAKNIKRSLPEATTVFLLPPSMEELERRLRNRATEDTETITRRLNTAKEEMQEQDFFDIKLINNNVDVVVEQLLKLYASA